MRVPDVPPARPGVPAAWNVLPTAVPLTSGRRYRRGRRALGPYPWFLYVLRGWSHNAAKRLNRQFQSTGSRHHAAASAFSLNGVGPYDGYGGAIVAASQPDFGSV